MTSFPKVQRKCERCGSAVSRFGSKFCGRQCASLRTGERRRENAIRRKNCVTCGRVFESLASRVQKYCSRVCLHKAQKVNTWVVMACDQCKAKIRRLTSSRKKHRFCSVKCRMAFYVGPKNSSWRGGHSSLRGSSWLRRAAAVRDRDGHVCQRCGLLESENGGRALTVDHIKPWRAFEDKEAANDPSNLIAICNRCHGHKTSTIERRWLRGDVLAMKQYEQSIRLPSAVTKES